MRLSLVRGRGGALAIRNGLMVGGWVKYFFYINTQDFHNLSYSSHKNLVIKNVAAGKNLSKI